jgi:4-hydroxy-tetrahydrodipicolinate synthase
MPTPFEKGGEVDKKRLKELTDYLIEGGIDGLFPLGTTGEFALLDRIERKRIVEIVADRANGRVPVLAGICDPSPRNAVSFARDAADAGADGVVATPPYYYRLSEEGIYTHFKMIHESVALPLVVYNIPEWTHNFVPVSVVSRLAAEEAVIGMKYTEYNMLTLLEFIKAVGKRIAVMTGSDAMAFECLEAGGSGAVISVANIFPKRASSIYDLVREGRHMEALRVQKSLFPAIEAAGMGYFPAGLKEAMKAIGFPVGTVREPQTQLDAKQRETVQALMKRANRNIFDLAESSTGDSK